MRPNYILAIIIPILCITTIFILFQIHDSGSSQTTSQITTTSSSNKVIHFTTPESAMLPQSAAPATVINASPSNLISKEVKTETSKPQSTKSKATSAKSTSSGIPNLSKPKDINVCSQEIVNQLAKPRLSQDDIDWCKYALSPSGGNVQVGKSWGTLKHPERVRFDKLDCNSVSTGKNPSCDDTWGDRHVQLWRKQPSQTIDCSPSPSSIQCYKNENNDQYCVFNHAQIDFSKMRQVPNTISGKPSRAFDKSFLTIDCSRSSGDSESKQLKEFHMDHLFSISFTKSQRETCDVFIPGITLLYSHDNIRNMGHTWQDITNVWLMLWLEKLAQVSETTVQFLTIDALRQYNYFDDVVNEFYFFYQNHFANISSPKTYWSNPNDYNPGKKRTDRVCFEQLITQPLPARGFVWDSWNQDLPCSFLGPSSLYQRFNYHVRTRLGFLHTSHISQHQEKIKVLIIVRSETANDWGSYRTGRLTKNLPQIKQQLNTLVKRFDDKIEIISQDFKDIPKMQDQLELISQVGVIIGMHGAGNDAIDILSDSPLGNLYLYVRNCAFDAYECGEQALLWSDRDVSER
jgi:hypothetical protein